MDERLWLRFYDKRVPPSLDYPKVPLHRLLDDAATKFPERIALSFLGKRIRYAELLRLSEGFARGLSRLGVKKGDRVILYLPNVPHMVIGYYGTLKAGAVCVTTNPLYTERELLYQVRDSGAKILVTLDLRLTLPKALAVKEKAGVERIVVGRVSDYLPFPKSLLYPLAKRKDLAKAPRGGECIRFRDLVSDSSPAPALAEAGPDDDAVLMYTGGTTGVSKGAILTHMNLVANAMQTFCCATGGAMSDAPQESILTLLPLYHSFSMTVCMNQGVLRGARMILFPGRPKPDMSDLLAVIRDEQPGILPGVPALYTAMANNPRIKEYGVECIKICVSGAAPLPVEVLQRFESVTGAKILEGFGLSEASPLVASNPLEGTRKPGSIGLPVPDTDVRIVNQETGQDNLAPGEAGELLVKGPQVMRGYWNQPDETQIALRDGWLYTGDVARMDDSGYLFIVDRKKDMIITGGLKIYPREVEEVLYEHPKVLDAAVIGIKDERCGERVKAFVVLKEDQSATSEELVEHCKQRLAAYKVPKSVEFRPELPKSNVGKVLRRLLRE